MSEEAATISVSKIEAILRKREQLQINIDARNAFIDLLDSRFDYFRLELGGSAISFSPTSKTLVEDILRGELLMYQEKLYEIENKLISISLLMQ